MILVKKILHNLPFFKRVCTPLFKILATGLGVCIDCVYRVGAVCVRIVCIEYVVCVWIVCIE